APRAARAPPGHGLRAAGRATGLVRVVRPSRAADATGRDQPELAGAPDRVAAPVGVELAVDVLQVALDRVQADEELARDLLGGQHRRQVAQHGKLARAESLAQR